MRNMRNANAGQSIVEYLLVAALVITAVALGIGAMTPGVNGVYTNAGVKANAAAAALGALVIP